MFFERTKFKTEKELTDYIYKKYYFSYPEESEVFSVGRNRYIARRALDYQGLVLDLDIVVCFAEWVLETLCDRYPRFQLLGMETSGIPLVAAISMYLKMKYEMDIPISYMRKKKDSSGRMNFIEGGLVEDVPIIFLDEHYFTGETYRKAKLILSVTGHSISESFFLVNSQHGLLREKETHILLQDFALSNDKAPVFPSHLQSPLQKIDSLKVGYDFLSLDPDFETLFNFSQTRSGDSLFFSYLERLYKLSFRGESLSLEKIRLSFVNNFYRLTFITETKQSLILTDTMGFIWGFSKDFKSKSQIKNCSKALFLRTNVFSEKGIGDNFAVASHIRFRNITEILVCNFEKDAVEKKFSVAFPVQKVVTLEKVLVLSSGVNLYIFDYFGKVIQTLVNIESFFVESKHVYYVSGGLLQCFGIENKQTIVLGSVDLQTKIISSTKGVLSYSKTGSLHFYNGVHAWSVIVQDLILLRPLSYKGYLFVATITGAVYVLNHLDGTVLSRYEFGDQVIELQIFGEDKILCVTCTSIFLFSFDENGKQEALGLSKAIYIQ